ncbi:MAG TPA: Gfo/Idh/MocA family oxidoreductase [Devosia sp.]|jgi:predicted dehydrogenase|uniref:Gfo/Idh/MocA family protein n=1 Tax=Devosia sp. TaxID=1871048 RepID=UPI002DDCD602|nr:Gfo/Idh/MocA family oxidoreductase [Devosia sp.]HEV2516581.1 Gfo/Idh/MocA family oxidoreductase [Devosia sp.]
MAPIRFGMIGGGWRAEFFTRIARELPERFQLAGVVQRDRAKAAAFGAAWGAPAFASYAELAAAEPDFVVLSVKPEAHLAILTELHQLGLAVLCETPAALDVETMTAIWRLVEQGLRLHIAEQYLFQPLHAARLQLIANGGLGRVSFARVSAAHGYHGVSLMRQFLGIGFDDAVIRGKLFEARALEGPNRFSWPESERFATTRQTLGEFDFGDKLGLFDFTDVQYRSPVHSHRVVIRGERGEIADLEARVMPTYGQPLTRPFTRNESGRYGNLFGYALEAMLCGDEVVWTMPYSNARLMDDEIAIAVAMEKMGALARGQGEGPYPFAEGAQDQYLSLLMHEAARSGETVRSVRQAWAG